MSWDWVIEMGRDELIGNITTIGKFILLATGVPSLVSFANSNDFVIFMGAVFGVVWAFYDSKYFNTFFKRNNVEPINGEQPVLNDEYEFGDDDGC